MPSPATISSFLLAAIWISRKEKARHCAGPDEDEGGWSGGAVALPEPGLGELVLLLEAVDELALLEREANIVEAVQQAVLAEGIDVEADAAAIGTGDLLLLQIDAEDRIGPALGVVHQLVEIFLGDLDRQDAILEAVVVENVGEAGGDHAADAEIQQRP